MSFELLVDLGEIKVPDGYVHGKRLARFYRRDREKFCYFNDAITDKNFPNPSRILKPGDRLRVRVFRQVIVGTTTPEERMAFLVAQGAVYPGAQGASLVFRQHRNKLPKGLLYGSFDVPERLSKDTNSSHGMPYIVALSGGGFDFDLYSFERSRDDAYCLLCFNEV